MQQSTPLRFHPTTGRPFVGHSPLAAEFRSSTFSGFWVYNPWTGQKRDPRDIETDHHGKLIVPDGEAIYASGALLARTDFKAPNLPEITKPGQLLPQHWYVLSHKVHKCWSLLQCENRGTANKPAMAFKDGNVLIWCTDENNAAMHHNRVYGPIDSPVELLGKLYIEQ